MMTNRPRSALATPSWAGHVFHRHEPALIWLGLMLYLSLIKLILDT